MGRIGVEKQCKYSVPLYRMEYFKRSNTENRKNWERGKVGNKVEEDGKSDRGAFRSLVILRRAVSPVLCLAPSWRGMFLFLVVWFAVFLRLKQPLALSISIFASSLFLPFVFGSFALSFFVYYVVHSSSTVVGLCNFPLAVHADIRTHARRVSCPYMSASESEAGGRHDHVRSTPYLPLSTTLDYHHHDCAQTLDAICHLRLS